MKEDTQPFSAAKDSLILRDQRLAMLLELASQQEVSDIQLGLNKYSTARYIKLVEHLYLFVIFGYGEIPHPVLSL